MQRPGRGLLLGAVGLAVWLLLLAWLRPLSDPDEGRYAVVALDMLHRGDWVTPQLNGLPFFHKPPLYYWLAASGFAVFGVHEWVARLPSILGAWLAAVSLFALVRRQAGETTAAVAALVLVTMPLVYLAAQYANMDMLLAGCVSACAACAWLATQGLSSGQRWRWWISLAGAFAGLGFLAKGLIGIVLPGMVWCLWLLWERRWRAWWLPLYPPAVLALCLVAAPWALVAQARHPQFAHYFFVTQHFQRYTATGFNNPQPWWFYGAVLALACLPWTCAGLYGLLQRWRSRPAARPADQPQARLSPPWGLPGLDRYMLVWFVVVVGFFSIPQSKIVGYVLPAAPPLAYGVARLWREKGGERGAPYGRRWQALAGLAAGLCVAAAVALATVALPAKARWQQVASLPVAPGDQLMMLGHLYYELPFYMPIQQPAWIVDDWGQGRASKADNWRRELLDAAGFAPAAGPQRLIDAAQAQQLLCRSGGAVWVVGELAAAQQLLPAVVSHPTAMQVGPHMVWRWQRPDAGCPAAAGP